VSHKRVLVLVGNLKVLSNSTQIPSLEAIIIIYVY